jgi:hypothetical protein
MNRSNLLLLAALSAASFSSSAATLCVNPGGTGGCFGRIGDAVAASAPGDTVTVAAGTYNESGIFIGHDVDIQGAGADATIVDGTTGGANGPTIFSYPNDPPSVRNTISGLTIEHGARGVNVGRFNDVTLDHVHVTLNGPLTGAGVFNGASTLHVTRSLIDHNSATDEADAAGCDWGGGSGGGIASLCGGGSNYIAQSTVADNVASRWGGGIIVNDGTTVIENSTIAGNESHFPDSALGGSALFVGGAFPDVTLKYATVADNTATASGGGALQADSHLKLYATLVQHNAGGDCSNGSTLVSLGYNMASDASCPFGAAGDAASTDAQLGALADNGGDTPTMALPAASRAVDRIPGDLCNEAVDQGGVARPQHYSCDVGAFERVWTTTDLANLLLVQIVGPGIPSGIASEASLFIGIILSGHPQVACRVLPNIANDVQNLAIRGRIAAPRASAIVQTIEALEGSIGC